jgi:hypothetical protein
VSQKYAPKQSVPAIENQTFANDIVGEEGHQPDVIIHIDGLDEEAIAKWWEEFKKNPENLWKTFSQNCSTVTIMALIAGGADFGWFSNHKMIWTPNKVEKFTNRLKAKLDGEAADRQREEAEEIPEDMDPELIEPFYLEESIF